MQIKHLINDSTNLDWECICRKPHWYDWDILTSHPECTLDVVWEYPLMPWRLMALLEKDLEYQNVATIIWSKLLPIQKTARISWQIISQLCPYDPGFLSKYRRFLDWNILSRRNDVPWDLVQRTYMKDMKDSNTNHEMNNSHKTKIDRSTYLPWVFSALSKNRTLTIDIVSSMLDSADRWNEAKLIYRFRLRPDYFSKFMPAVQTIQQHWLRAYYDPNHTSGVCARRLTRQVDEDSDSIQSIQSANVSANASSIYGSSPVNPSSMHKFFKFTA